MTERTNIMQRFLKWLGDRLSPAEPAPALRDSHPHLRVVPSPVKEPPPKVQPRPEPDEPEPELVDFHTELGGRIEEAGPGKNVLIRNKYLREDSGTHETLKIIDDSIIDTGEEPGFDPYNTGQFDRSRSWKSRN